jgi:hypothetical protein
MGWINREQFKDLATEANTIPPGDTEAGFSVSAKQSSTGELVPAADRFMVGGTPGQVTTTRDVPISGRHLASFTRANRTLLDQPEHYVGAWHEGERKPAAQVDLDVSQGFPRTEQGGLEARTAALARNERSLGEVDEKAKYAGTHTNPFSTKPLSDEEPIESYLDALRSDPEAYASVVGGSVEAGMASWLKGSPVARSKSG